MKPRRSTFVGKTRTMAKHLFTSDNQPEHRGRPKIAKEERITGMTITLPPEVKAWYAKRRGLARRVLEEYRKSVIE